MNPRLDVVRLRAFPSHPFSEQVFNSSASFDEWFAAPFKGAAEDMRQALREEEQFLVINRLHQVRESFGLEPSSMHPFAHVLTPLLRPCAHCSYVMLPP